MYAWPETLLSFDSMPLRSDTNCGCRISPLRSQAPESHHTPYDLLCRSDFVTLLCHLDAVHAFTKGLSLSAQSHGEVHHSLS